MFDNFRLLTWQKLNVFFLFTICRETSLVSNKYETRFNAIPTLYSVPSIVSFSRTRNSLIYSFYSDTRVHVAIVQLTREAAQERNVKFVKRKVSTVC